MKNFLCFIILAGVFFLSACTETQVAGNAEIAEDPEIVTTEQEIVTTEPEISTTADTSEPVSEIAEIDLSPLELIGYTINEDGEVILNYKPSWLYERQENGDRLRTERITDEFSPDEFREYFFGTWRRYADSQSYDGYLVIDDSEESNNYPFMTGRVGRAPDNPDVVINSFMNGGMSAMFWIDINRPDVMYMAGELGFTDEGLSFGDINRPHLTILRTWIKQDLPVNLPEDESFMSRLKLLELEQKYEIPHDMVFVVRVETEDGRELLLNDHIFSNNVYLVSEEPDKIVLKSVMYTYPEHEEAADVVYTIEKINGEWVRDVQLTIDN